MSQTAAGSSDSPISAARWPQLIGALGLLFSAGLMLHCWFWVVTIGLAFGPRPSFWLQLAGVLIGVVVAMGLAVWVSWRHKLATIWCLLAAKAWRMAAGSLWWLQASPFSLDPRFVGAFVVSSWWLLAAWMAWLLPLKHSARAGAFITFAAVSAVALASVEAQGIDGAALPRIAWRFSAAEPQVDTPPPAELTPNANPVTEEFDEAVATVDFPRFRGADGHGVVVGEHLTRDWSIEQPKLLWKRAIGAGWGSLAVAGGRVFTQEQRGKEECVVCYHRPTGRQLWVHQDKAHYEGPSTGDGPRATPTVDDERVFSLGATGILNCLDRRSGKLHWSINILDDTKATAPPHGMVGSPLVAGELVVVCAGSAQGGTLVAYDKATGMRAWSAGNENAGYTSPQLFELAGVPQIVIVSPQTVEAHDPLTGRVLWTHPFVNEQQTNCSQPSQVGTDRLLVSSNYGNGCILLELRHEGSKAWTAQEIWRNRTLQTKFSSPVVRDQFAYGLDDGILECVSLADGSRQWKRGRYGHGQLMLVDDLLVIQAEDGRVAMVEAAPTKFTELASFQPLDDKTWNYPVVAGGQLLVRNANEAACYELPVRDAPR